MGKLADELRKKYRTPSEALVALGLDAAILKGDNHEKEPVMSKKVLSRFATASVAALGVYLQPKLAADSKLDLNALFDGVSKKNFLEKKADIKAKIKLAKDADIEDMHKFIDRLDKNAPEEGADADPNSGLPMNADEMKAKDAAEEEEKKKKEGEDRKARDMKARDAIKDKLSAEDLKGFDDIMGSCDETEEAKKDVEGEKTTVDAVSPKAMDAALKKMGEDTAARVRREMQAVAEAREFVTPWVGKLSLALDSAEAVYRGALDVLKIKHTGIHADALKPILEAQAKPGQRQHLAEDRSLLNDDQGGFSSRWGEAANRLSA